MDNIIETYPWETEFESLVEILEDSKFYKKKKRKKRIKCDFKFYKNFIKPNTYNNTFLNWKSISEKNLKRYFFKKNLKKVYEPEILTLTTKNRRILKIVKLKTTKVRFLKLKKSKKNLLSYKRLFFCYNWSYLQKKLIYYFYK